MGANKGPKPVFTPGSLQAFRESLQVGQEFAWNDLVTENERNRLKRRTYVICEKWPWFVKAYQKRNKKAVRSFMYTDLMIEFGKKEARKRV